jgi:hypothetical protein
MAMMAMTTSSSISVKPRLRLRNVDGVMSVTSPEKEKMRTLTRTGRMQPHETEAADGEKICLNWSQVHASWNKKNSHALIHQSSNGSGKWSQRVQEPSSLSTAISEQRCDSANTVEYEQTLRADIGRVDALHGDDTAFCH